MESEPDPIASGEKIRQRQGNSRGWALAESQSGLPPWKVRSPAWRKGQGPRGQSSGIQFQSMEHELKDIVPAIEENVAEQSLQMLEESAASSQSLADGLVFLIHQFQDRVHQES